MIKSSFENWENSGDIFYRLDLGLTSKPSIILTFNKLPMNCGECPLYQKTFYKEDEPLWGEGTHHYCPFGGDQVGCMVERPANCPIKEACK